MAKERKPLKFTATRPWTSQDDVWAEAAQDWEVQALPTLRAAAERWAAGLAVLLGGSGIGVLLAGPDELAVLSHPYEGWAKALLFAAGVTGTVALMLALLAAGVTTKTLFLISGPSLRQSNREAVRAASSRQVKSRWATFAALILLLGCAALLFFAPQDRAETVSTHGSSTTSPAQQSHR